MLSLITEEELGLLSVRGLPGAVRSRHMEWWHAPIPDGRPPGPEFEDTWAVVGEAVRNRLRLGPPRTGPSRAPRSSDDVFDGAALCSSRTPMHDDCDARRRRRKPEFGFPERSGEAIRTGRTAPPCTPARRPDQGRSSPASWPSRSS